MMDENESLQKCVSEDKPDEEDVCPICLEGSVSLEHRIICFQFGRILIKLCLLGWCSRMFYCSYFPTLACLIEYDEENPRSMTKCEHHFHLCCILEWMERSETCPVCDQITMIDAMYE
uniref:RING-type E3 ubiquitin transferase n=1 Tax=Oryza punctata TaxID=4537 RepID=A0A0E0M5F8_ORYPU